MVRAQANAPTLKLITATTSIHVGRPRRMLTGVMTDYTNCQRPQSPDPAA